MEEFATLLEENGRWIEAFGGFLEAEVRLVEAEVSRVETEGGALESAGDVVEAAGRLWKLSASCGAFTFRRLTRVSRYFIRRKSRRDKGLEIRNATESSAIDSVA